MNNVSPDGRDYTKREHWSRAEWRRITVRDMRLCKCKKWVKQSVLERFDGTCQKCKREIEQAKAAAKKVNQ
jgi:hypothetical protein